MKLDWRSIITSVVAAAIIGFGSNSLSWSYHAGQYEYRLQQTESQVNDMHEMNKNIEMMSKVLVEMQTEMKYYRRDIDELRNKQGEISVRLDHIADDNYAK